jgi:hypothetical protein
MAKAPSLLGVHPTSMSHDYKVFQHLMLWMGIWVHTYTVMPVQVGGVFFRKIGVRLIPNDVVIPTWSAKPHP